MQSDCQILWKKCLEIIKDNLPEEQFNTWFRPIIPYSFNEKNEFRILVPSNFFGEYIEANFQKLLLPVVRRVMGPEVTLIYRVATAGDVTDEDAMMDSHAEPSSNKEMPHTSVPNLFEQRRAPQDWNSYLNPKYSFDNYFEGTSNKVVRSASEAIAQNPGTSFNPCLIYGGVGLGKTHLLESIGNYIDEHNPKMKIIYTTAESFTNEFIDSLLSKEKISSFKSKYRNVDVLLIDDIHFLQKKDSTQEELFHTFNELYDNHKQIVLTCDRPITELTDITDRLKTRFRKGINVDLQPPAYETRMAIAMQKCRERGYSIDQKVLEFICENINTNVRDLEGALTTLSSFAELVGKPVTIEIAREQLKNFIIEPAIKNTDITIDTIIHKTATYFNVKDYDIRGKSRNKNIMLARHISIYLASELTSYSLSEIGKVMNGKDHTTIMYSVEKIKSIMETDDSVKQAINDLKKDILS